MAATAEANPGLILRLLYRLLAHPIAVILTVLIVVSICTAGIARLSITSDLRVYFSADNPQLAALEELEDKYQPNDSLVLLLRPRDGATLWDAQHLAALYALTERSWRIPYSHRVISLANHQHTRAAHDTLETRALIVDPKALDTHSVAEIRNIAATDESLAGRLAAVDGSLASVTALLTLPAQSDAADDEVIAAGKALARDIEQEFGVDVLVGGSVASSVAVGAAVAEDLRTLVALSLLFIITALSLLLRSVAATLLIVAIMGCSVLATLGLFGWFGFVLSPTAGFVPSVIMTMAVADCVHINVSYLVALGRGQPAAEALREALRINLTPVAITSLSTAIGLLSLNFSDSPPYRDLGNMVAVGVVVAFLLSLTLLPAVLSLLPVPVQGAAQTRRIPAGLLADWIIARRHWLLGGGTVILLIVASFIPRNELTERWHDYYGPEHELRRTTRAYETHIGGLHRLYYDLESGEPGGIADPEFLAETAAFADWFAQQPGVKTVNGLHQTLRSLHRSLHGDDPAYYRLPATREAAAQYLLLYELSLPLGAGMDNLTDQDRSATRLTVAVQETDSEQLLALDRAAQHWLKTNTTRLQTHSGTGMDLMFAHITHRNARALLRGTAVALALISLLLIVMLRSFRLGFISLLPNLAPATLAYGLWGLSVGHIDLALSVVVCMSLGIVVDDTVHFLSKYQRARKEYGYDAADGVRYAFRTVGIALLITTAVLVGGFLVLTLSEFTPTRETGALLALTLGLALLVDFFLLPPLLLAADRPNQESLLPKN